MFRSFDLKYPAIVILLLCALSIGSASAAEPSCTITYSKAHYNIDETINAHYKIDFDGDLSALYVEWVIISDWEKNEIQPSDSFQELTALEGDLSFTPEYGEGAVPYFTLIKTDGSAHSLWGDSVQIIGSTSAEPTCSVTFDKETYAPGETINAHYSIDYAGEFSALYVEWSIISDWEKNEIQPSDSFQELTALEGDLSFTPEYGEGAVPYFTLIKTDGSAHSLWGDSVQIIGSTSAEPTCSVTFDKETYTPGETINAHYSIDYAGEFSALYVEWGIITDWEKNEIEPSDSFQELTILEGDISFTPEYGEGAVPYFTLVKTDNSSYSLWGNSVQIIGSASAEPTCSVTFDKESYTLGETINAHYKIDFDGAYASLYAEWCIITDWETNEIQYGDSYHELTALEGDLSFTPAYGEGANLYLTLAEENGEWYSLSDAPVRIFNDGITNLPKALTTIREEAFKAAQFTCVVCPEGLQAIESRAFSDCTNLQSITIPASVQSIADDAFEGCTSLTLITTERGSIAEDFAIRHDYEIKYM